jgi:pilus assembly protein FimV
MSGAQAATADAASAPTAASAPLEAGSQYTIRPGQSLNDVAVAATQSHDRATLARASKALFDANPNAFMSHDPSRLRVGAVLTIPSMDATGAAVGASGAMAASSSAAAAGSASAPASPATPTAASAVSQSTAAQANGGSVAMHAPAAATIPASAPLQASSATTVVASTPLAGSAPATVAEGAASAAVGASSTVPAAALPSAPASGAHVWAGAIQPSASAPLAGASEALPSAPSAAAPVAQAPTQVSSLQQLLALKSRVLMELQKHGIGGKPAQPAQAGAVATVGGQASAAAGTVAGSGVPGNGGTATTHVTAGNLDLSPVNLGFAAAIGAALVALLAAFGLRRRKTRVTPADAAVAARVEALGRPEAGPTPVSVAPHEDIDARERAALDEDDVSDAAAVAAVSPEAAAREAAEREAAAQEAAEREVAARDAAERDAAVAHEAGAGEVAAREAAEQVPAIHEAESQETAAREAAEREAAARDAALRAATLDQEPASLPHDALSHEPLFAEESAPDTHGGASDSNAAAVPSAFDATEHASSAAAHATPSEDTHAGALNPVEDTASAADFAGTAEPRADALPPTQFESEAEQASQRAQSDVDQWNQAANHSLDETAAVAPAESHNPPLPQIDFGAPAPLGEPQTDSPFGQTFGGEPSFKPASYQQPDTPTPQPEAPIEHNPFDPAPQAQAPHAETASHEPPTPHTADTAFPSEAASADTLAEPSAATGFPRAAVDAFGSLDMGLPPRIEPVAPLTPPASLSTQPVVEPEITAQQAVPPLPAAPRHAADEINAGTAGSAAVAGLGAAHFGALNLDFDLELPPSPAQPLPSFTPQDLVRIARNKLDLASEYIELGDLAGARSLIHEVIDANDAATRTEARALLSTLSPLS